jgi:hypothetical protein
MSQIILDIDDIDRVNTAFSAIYNRPENSNQTPIDFTKSNLINFVKSVVSNHEGRVAQQEAIQKSIDNVNSTLTIE